MDLHLDPTDLPQLGLLPNTPELPDVLNSSKPFRSQFAQMQRIFHTATALNNGKILVIGGASGKGSSPTIFNSVEIYDPETGTWASAAPLPHQLMRHTATLLADGKVFVVGGTDNISSAACLTNTALYDPATDTWTATATMTTGRCFHTATLLGDGRVVVIGGRTQNSGADTTNNYTATVEIYDPTTNSWSAGNSLPAARAYHRAVLLTNSKIFVAGGINSSGGIAITALYNPSGNSWSSGPTLSPYRKLPSATLLGNGLVALVGGENSGTALTNTTLYNPDTNTLSEGAALPAGRYLHSATALGNNLIIAGGSSISANLFQDSLIYNSTANQWQAFANLKGFRSEHAAVIAGKYLVLLGGTTGIYAYSPLHTTAEKLDVSAFLWKNETPMTVSRFIPVASALKNGKVMIAGGVTTSPSFGYLLSTEIFDPVTNQWTAGPDLPGPRARATGTLLNNGKVLVVGGQDNAAILSSTVIYDPDTNSWSPGPSLTYARTAHTATLLPDGRVFVAGGTGDFGGTQIVAQTEIYDPNTNTWSVGASMPTPVFYSVATASADGKIIVTGGQVSTFQTTVQIYNISTGTWSTGASMTTARVAHAAVLLNSGKILVAAGYNSSGSVGSSEIYDVSTNTWTAGPALNVARNAPSAMLLADGKVLLAGGEYAPGRSTATAEIYDPDAGTWTLDPRFLNTPRALASTFRLNDGRFLLVGGANGNLTLSSAESFHEATAAIPTWQAPSLTSSRLKHTATLLQDGRVFVAGGSSDNIFGLSSTALYNPLTNEWTAGPNLSSARIYHTATLLPSGKVFIAGGQVPGPGGDFCQTADVYDPATDSITTITLTEKRSLHEALLLPDGKVLLSGGTGGTNAPTTNEICDPVAGTCTAANGRTMGAYEVAVKLNTGRFLLIGAFGVSSYNPQDDSWTAVAPLLTPRVFHTATLLPSGKVLVTGGVDAATLLPNGHLMIFGGINSEYGPLPFWEQVTEP